MRGSRRGVIILALAAITGFLSMVLPPHLIGDAEASFPSFDFVGQAVEDFNFGVSGSLLALIGLVFGFLLPRKMNWIWVGVASVILLPATAILDMVLNRTSHNLWPLEFVLYAFYSVPALLGAALGRMIRRMFSSADAPAEEPSM